MRVGGCGRSWPPAKTSSVRRRPCAQTILEHHESGKALKDQVVLFRTSHHSDLLEVELGRRGVPFVKYGGLRFLEASHVRDLLAALRLVENPWDELAWLRVLQLADGIGPKSASRMMKSLECGSIGFAGPNPLDRFCPNPARSAEATVRASSYRGSPKG